MPAETLAAFLDGRLEGEERSRAEAELARNPELRAEMIAAARMVAKLDVATRSRTRFIRPLGVVAVAAAAIALMIVPAKNRAIHAPPVASERQIQAEDGGRLTLVTPTDVTPVDPGALQFVWRSEGDATYRFTLADSTGHNLFTAETSDTSAKIPPAVRLDDGNRYYWYVDALRADGSSIASGPRSFTVARR